MSEFLAVMRAHGEKQFRITYTARQLLSLVGAMQLALRHPEFATGGGEPLENARLFVQQARDLLGGTDRRFAQLIDAGEDPAYDDAEPPGEPHVPAARAEALWREILFAASAAAQRHEDTPADTVSELRELAEGATKMRGQGVGAQILSTISQVLLRGLHRRSETPAEVVSRLASARECAHKLLRELAG